MLFLLLEIEPLASLNVIVFRPSIPENHRSIQEIHPGHSVPQETVSAPKLSLVTVLRRNSTSRITYRYTGISKGIFITGAGLCHYEGEKSHELLATN